MYDNQIKIFHFKNDLKVIISNFLFNHSTSIGGCRHKPYHSLHEAINDCYDLSHAMALKAYHLGIPYGGAKSVIYNPNELAFETIAPYVGESINALKGTYIASIDIGIGLNEIDLLSKYTDYVYGTKAHHDPSEYTAQGVIESIKYLISHIKKAPNQITIAIQGIGKVGSLIAKYFLEQGSTVYGADINEKQLQIFSSYPNFKIRHCDDILTTECDILVPSAGGNVINASNINQLQTNYICSAANNPIDNPNLLTDQLYKKGIIFLPDFITNNGGLLSVANFFEKNKNKQLSIDCIPKKIQSLINEFNGENLYRITTEQFEVDI